MRLIVATVLCLGAFIGTSRSMPVADSAPGSSSEPSSPSTRTAEDGSLLVVPLEKDALPESVAVKKIVSESAESHEHQAAEPSARSSEPVATIPEAVAKPASEIVETAQNINDAVARAGEAAQSLLEEKSPIEVPAASSVPQTEPHATPVISGKHADGASSSLDLHESLAASAKSSSDIASKPEETPSPVAEEKGASAKSAPADSEIPQVAASPSQESSEKQLRVVEPVVSESSEPNNEKAEDHEIKKEAEATIEKTDRVTREAEEAAAAAAKATAAPLEPAPAAAPSSSVPAAESPVALPASQPAGAPKIDASIAEIEKPQEAAAAATSVAEQSASVDSARAAGNVEKEESATIAEGQQAEKKIEKKSVTAEEVKPIDKAAEPASGHAASEKSEIEGAGGSLSDVASGPQAKSEIAEATAAEAIVKSINEDAAAPAAHDSAKNVQPASAEGATADSAVRAVKESEESSEEREASTATSDKKDDSSATFEAKSSLSADTADKSTKSVAPEEIKAEELPKPQEVTAIKESSEKREVTSKESSESSESSESDEATSGKRVEHSE